MRRFSAMLLIVVAVCSFCGCGSLFFAQVEEPDLCKTISTDFPAAPPVGTDSEQVAVDFDLRSELESFTHSDTTSNMHLKYVEFDAAQGISDFGFVDSAKITVQGSSDPSCNLPDLVTYQRDPSARPQSTLTLTGSNAIDLMPCLSAGKVTLETNFSGRLPTGVWSMNVKSCFSGTARINYLGGK